MVDDVNNAAMSVADALGADFTDLAPPGEEHFDPATISLLVAVWIIKAVADGIHDGIQEAAKEGTLTTLQAVARGIRERIIPKAVRSLFSADSSNVALEAERASTHVERARELVRSLPEDTFAQLGSASGAAAADSLRACGLGDTAAERVGRSVEVQVKVVLGGSGT
jgi:hypothetical protein